MTLLQLLERLYAWLSPGLRHSADAHPVAVAASFERLRGLVSQCPDSLSAVPTDTEIRRFVELLLEQTPTDRIPLANAIRLLGKLPGSCRSFEHLQPNTIIYQLLLRLINPNRIDQGSLGLCGTVTSQLPFLAANPLQFAQVASELLLYGCLALPGQEERGVPPEILDANPGISLPQADWLVLASIRSAPTWQVEKVGTASQGGYGSANAEDMFKICVRQYGTCVLLNINGGGALRCHPNRSTCEEVLPRSLLAHRGRMLGLSAEGRRRLETLIECLRGGCIVMLETDGQMASAAKAADGLGRPGGVAFPTRSTTGHWVLLESCEIAGGNPETVSYRIRTWRGVFSLDRVPLDVFLPRLTSAIIVPPIPDATRALSVRKRRNSLPDRPRPDWE